MLIFYDYKINRYYFMYLMYFIKIWWFIQVSNFFCKFFVSIQCYNVVLFSWRELQWIVRRFFTFNNLFRCRCNFIVWILNIGKPRTIRSMIISNHSKLNRMNEKDEEYHCIMTKSNVQHWYYYSCGDIIIHAKSCHLFGIRSIPL